MWYIRVQIHQFVLIQIRPVGSDFPFSLILRGHLFLLSRGLGQFFDFSSSSASDCCFYKVFIRLALPVNFIEKAYTVILYESFFIVQFISYCIFQSFKVYCNPVVQPFVFTYFSFLCMAIFIAYYIHPSSSIRALFFIQLYI